MACNYDNGYKYYYPVTFQLYPTNQLPKTYVTQCESPQYYYNFYEYQNQMRKLQNREVTIEYWIRQLEYFRNLLKNFAAEIETPEDLKKLLATCKCDDGKKKCFEKRRSFYNMNKKKKSNCCCNSCLDKLLLKLCNALSIPAPPCNICNCSACCGQCRCKKPCCAKCSRKPNLNANQSCNYIPYQANCPTPASYYYYYYPLQQQQQFPCQMPPVNPSCYPNSPCYPNFSCFPNYCQQMPQPFNGTCCPPNYETCCNKCKFKYLLNQINYILTSAEQLKVPYQSQCANNIFCQKSCCSIEEIKEETVKITRESVVEDRNAKKSMQCNTTNVDKQGCMKSCHDTENIATSKGCSIKKPRKYHSESSKTHTIHSDCETINDASNISEEYKNYDTTCIKKQASIVLGEEYTSPSGTFEVLIQDQPNESCKMTQKQNNSSLVFQVGYMTYTKPKCDVENEI